MGMWMGLEINLISFIPLISQPNNIKSSQSSIIYFLAQRIGSIAIIFSVIVNPLILIAPDFMNEFIKTILIMALLLKLGAAPIHKWFPEIINNINWGEIFLLITWQKLAPLYIIRIIVTRSPIIYFSIISSAVVGAIGGLNTTSIRKIIAYSSINHLRWIIVLLIIQSTWRKYLILYRIILLLACSFFRCYNSFNISQIINKTSSFIEKYTYSSTLLRIGGLPPFLGFLPKWITMQAMINRNYIWIIIIMLLISIVTLFYYLRLIRPILIIYSTSNKWHTKKYLSNKLIIMIYINLLLPIILITRFY